MIILNKLQDGTNKCFSFTMFSDFCNYDNNKAGACEKCQILWLKRSNKLHQGSFNDLNVVFGALRRTNEIS